MASCVDGISGTTFTPINIASEEMLKESFFANYTPPIGSQQELVAVVDKLVELYPNVPALGSPYDTGNETFGLSSVYKQAAAIS